LTSQLNVPKGLEVVVVAQSKLSYVYGKEGRLVYRGYDIFDLAEHSTLEETAFLMLNGHLPHPPSSTNLAGPWRGTEHYHKT
jgi:citrate synthase